MLTELYVEALLVDQELADQVWEAWDKGEIDTFTAYFAWLLVSFGSSEIAHGQGWLNPAGLQTMSDSGHGENSENSGRLNSKRLAAD